MTSIDNLTIEDFDNEDSNYIGGGDDIMVYDIEKDTFNMSGGSNESIDPEANLVNDANNLGNVGGDEDILNVLEENNGDTGIIDPKRYFKFK